MKCLIIDDDPLITDLIKHYSDKCEWIEYCISCNDPLEGLKLLGNSSFDILFLDYNMPHLNGKDLLEIKNDSSKVIMITSSSSFAVDSYKYDAVVDYLVKPLDYDKFFHAVNRFANKRRDSQSKDNTEQNRLMLKDGVNWIPVDLKSIQYIKSDSNYCIFQTTNGRIMSLAKLKNLEDKLPHYFIRCHRSYIVNARCAEKISLEGITINNTEIPISQMYRNDIKKYIDLHF